MELSNWLLRQAPLVKLAVWAVGVIGVIATLHGAAWATDAPFSAFDKNTGGAVVIVVALAGLLVMMALESRPLADFGLAVGKNWRRQVGRGLLVGASVYLGYLCLLATVGVLRFDFAAGGASQWGKAALAAFSAGPLAVTQQIIFSGYLVSTLRDRHSRFTSVLVPAALLALATAAGKEGGVLGVEGSRLFVGMLLVGMVLGALRLRTGSIVLPAGILAGGILVRKVTSKARLLDFQWDQPQLEWLAPAGDPRQAPLMWSALTVACVAVGVVLWRKGETPAEMDADIDAGFKRIMPFSNLLGLAPLDAWARVLAGLRSGIGLAYVPRLAMSLLGSTIMTLLALPERIIFPLIAPLVLRRDPPPPVCIVGMHRSGTTHLHNLLALDRQFRSVRNCEAFNPHGFVTGWLTTALLTPLMTWRRPMDSVQMSPLSSQEEEFALAAMGAPSPYWSFCLPRAIAQHDRYFSPEGFTEAEERRWTRAYRLFVRKLCAWRRRTPLMKNPANTGRVAMVRQALPGAKFIHIVRHPHAVWRSNQRFASQGLVVFQLQDPRTDDNYATRCLENYRTMVDAYYRDTAELRDDEAAEVRFEDVEADPIGVVKSLYMQLGLKYTEAYDRRLRAYLERVSGYRKNRFAELPAEDRARIDMVMGGYVGRWGYADEDRAAA